MDRPHTAYGMETHTEKDSGKQHYWNEAFRKDKEKIG
jgi:hypothetical protein